MKTVLCLGLLLLAPSVLAAQLNATTDLQDSQAPQDINEPSNFARTIEDLPLMPGLSAVPEEDMLHITPRAGRVLESTAQGVVDIDAVYQFYRQTLPQLGWRKFDAHSYGRNGEQLRIDAHADGKLTAVHFTLRPQ